MDELEKLVRRLVGRGIRVQTTYVDAALAGKEPEAAPCRGCEEAWTDGGELCDRCAAEYDPHDRNSAGGRLS